MQIDFGKYLGEMQAKYEQPREVRTAILRSLAADVVRQCAGVADEWMEGEQIRDALREQADELEKQNG